MEEALLRHETRVMTDRYTHLDEKHAAIAASVREKITNFGQNRVKSSLEGSGL